MDHNDTFETKRNPCITDWRGESGPRQFDTALKRKMIRIPNCCQFSDFFYTEEEET